MGALHDLLHHPRRLWLRRAFFQIHLWVGVLFAVYLVGISLTGSVLVYRQELTRWSLPHTLNAYQPAHIADVEQVMRRFASLQEHGNVNLLQLPSAAMPAFLLEGRDNTGRPARWLGDPVTGALQLAPRTWLDTVLDFHDYLLLPHGWGMQANGVGAAGLLLLAITGLFLWWPGLRVWARGLRVNLRARGRRLNYDLHNAVGFWTLAIVMWWALSGVYFAWYRPFTAVVARVSPLRGMLAPSAPSLAAPPSTHHASLGPVLQAAQAASPHGRVWSVSDASLRGAESYVLLDLRAPGDFSHRDIVRVRSADARVLSIWHYGERHTAGDWILWSMHPLHFGTVWGPVVKAIWAVLGLSLALLTITGLLMYWNRFLRHRWRLR